LYVGQSAGAIIAGSSIQTALWKGWDDPTAGGSLADVEWTDAKLRSLGLVPDRLFFPHFEPEWAETVDKRTAELGAAGDGAEVVCLTDDGSGAHVSGDDDETQGQGAETCVERS